MKNAKLIKNHKTLQILGIVIFLSILFFFWFYSFQISKTPTNVSEEETKITILIFKNKYVPNKTVINRGETVAWKNMDIKSHILVIPQIPLMKTITPGKSFKFTFVRSGEYDFWDYENEEMVGKIVVINTTSLS